MKLTRIAAIALLLAGSAAWSQPPDAPASADEASGEPSPQQPSPEDAQDDPQRADVQDDQQPAEPATDPQAADVASVGEDCGVDGGGIPICRARVTLSAGLIAEMNLGREIIAAWPGWGAGDICWSDGSELHFGGSPSYTHVDVKVPNLSYITPMGIHATVAGRDPGGESLVFHTLLGNHGIGERLVFRVTRNNGRISVVLLRREDFHPDPRYTFPGEGTPCHEEERP